MLLSNLSQLNLDALKDKLPQGLPQGGEGDGGVGFLDALLQSQGISLSEEELARLATMLREDAAKGAVPGFLADLPVLDQPLGRADAAQAEQPEAELTEVTEADPQQLLALMLAAAGNRGGGAGAGKEDAALGVGQGRSTGLLAQLRNGLGGEMRAESALDAVQLQGAEPFRAQLARSEAAQGALQMRLDHPVQQPGFGQAVGERLVWMVQNQVQNARIRLDPPHLGPLEIAVSVQDDKTSVSIVAQHGVTREALQADMPRLREMLGANGFTEVDVNVAQGDGRGDGRAEGEADGQRGGFARGSAGEEGGEAGELDAPVRRGLGLVDHYA